MSTSSLTQLKERSSTHWAICKDCARSPQAAEYLAREMLELLNELQRKETRLTRLRQERDALAEEVDRLNLALRCGM